MRLLGVELRRFTSRRANIVFAALGLVLLVGALGILGLTSHKPNESEISEAKQSASEDREAFEQDLTECQAGEIETYGETCEEIFGTTQIDYTDYLDGVVNFTNEAEGQLTFLCVVFVVCALLMSGSFVGAEWTSGGMTNLLLWQPRRLPVLAAKMLAAVISVLVLTVAGIVLHLGGLYLVASLNGHVGTTGAQWWQENITLTLRIIALVVASTIVGVSLSMIGRRTVVALGAVVAYVVAVEFGFRMVVQSMQIFHPEYWVMSSYIQAWIVGSAPVRPYMNQVDASYEAIEMWTGGGALLGITAVLLSVAAVQFSRRDTV